MDALDLITGVLIVIGAGIMLQSITGTKRVLGLLNVNQYAKFWRILLLQMVFFFFGYLAAFVLVLMGLKDLVLILTGVVFLFGALFVYLVVRTGFLTIRDLLGQATTINKMLQDLQRSQDELQESSNRTKAILEGVLAGILVIDSETSQIIQANPAAVQMIGTSPDKILEAVCHKFVCPAERGQCPIRNLGQTVDNSERMLLRANGERLPIVKTVVPAVIAGRQCLIESFFDNTPHKQAEHALAHARDNLELRVQERTADLAMAQQALAGARDDLELRVQERTADLAKANEQLQAEIGERRRAEGQLQQTTAKLEAWVGGLEQRSREMVLLNEMGNLLQTCRAAAEAYTVIAQYAGKLFPNDSGALGIINASRSFVEVVVTWSASTPQDPTFAPDDCWALRRGQVHLVAEPDSRLVCPHVRQPIVNGTLCVPMMAQGEALGVLHLRDGDGTRPPQEEQAALAACRQNLAVAMAERIGLALVNLNLRETLRGQAIRDPLTGLYNRRYMEETFERELKRAARRQTAVGVIMLDIDHFKRLNDTFGHAAGDKVLRDIGTALRSETRAEDVACRYGGEEFVIVLSDISADDVLARAEQVRARIKNLDVQFQNQSLGSITVSAGVASYPEHGSSSETLIGAADGALYSAKRNGRDRVAVSHVDGVVA